MSEYGKKYPWLKIDSLYSSVAGSYYDAMDDMPSGWRIAFGDLLCEELDAAIKKAGIEDEFSILYVGEQYSHLIVRSTHDNIPEISGILYKYMTLSKNVCTICGKPDVYTIWTDLWSGAMCEECFSQTTYAKNSKYEDLTYAGDGKMRNSITMIRNNNGYEKHKIYIKDTSDKIRARWAEREIGRS